MQQKLFDAVISKVGEVLNERGYVRQGDMEKEECGYSVTYIKEDELAYNLFYNDEKKQFLLRYSDVENNEPTKDWKVRSAILADSSDEENIKKDIASVVNDFTAEIKGPENSAIIMAQTKKHKKSKKDDENNIDPLFFFNRIAGIDNTLRESIFRERIAYGDVRPAVFTKEKALPSIKKIIAEGNKNNLQKLAEIFNNMYEDGDLDTRTLVTIGVLNNLSEEEKAKLSDNFSDDLKKAELCAVKYKDKQVKPEKKKKKTRVVADRLNDIKNK